MADDGQWHIKTHSAPSYENDHHRGALRAGWQRATTGTASADSGRLMKLINGVAVLTTKAELLRPTGCALLVIDMQNENLTEKGGYARHGTAMDSTRAAIKTIAGLLPAARAARVYVVYAEFIHRSAGGAQLSDGPNLYVHRNAEFVSEVREGTWEAKTIDELAPESGDLVLPKTRSSAFHGTPLAAQLQTRAIHTVVITGMLTQGCILHTHADALMNGFYPIVAGDGVCTYEAEWHELAMRWMQRKSPVLDSTEIMAEWVGETAETAERAESPMRPT